MNTEKLDTIVSICLGVFTYFLIVSSFNAGYSISLAVLSVVVLYRLYKYKWFILMPPKQLLVLFGIFVFTLMVSAVYHGGSTISSTLKYIYWALPFAPIFLSYVKDKSELAFITGASLAMVTLSVKAYQQVQQIFFGTFVGKLRLTSLFTSPNDFGQIMELALPISMVGLIWSVIKYKISNQCIYKYTAIWQVIVMIFSLLPFVGTLSRGATLGFIGGGVLTVIVYGITSWKRYYKRMIAILCVLGAVGVGFSVINGYVAHKMWAHMPAHQLDTKVATDTKLSIEDVKVIAQAAPAKRPYDVQRIYMWQSSYHMWQDHPWMGVGFDNWQYEYEHNYILDIATERRMPMPHNNVMYFLSSTGLVGLVGYIIFTLGIIGSMMYAIYKSEDGIIIALFLWMFTAITIHGQLDSGITNKFVMHIIFGTLGVTCGYINYYKKQIVYIC